MPESQGHIRTKKSKRSSDHVKARALGIANVVSTIRSSSSAGSSNPTSSSCALASDRKSKKLAVAEPTVRTQCAAEAHQIDEPVPDRSQLLQWANSAIETCGTGKALLNFDDEDETTAQARTVKIRSEPFQHEKTSLSVTSPLVAEASQALDGKTLGLKQELIEMVLGQSKFERESQKIPGNYLAIDCEMVGMGQLGEESVLARVSIVNYHGFVILDTFVRPKERVTDWRTWVSGVRPQDMEHAMSFSQVQQQVAELIKGKILIGHAVENDTKALLLSHPSPLLRDTQRNPELRKIAKTKMPGLKKLTELELGLKIQTGAHSSVTDARATMALYRLHKTEWEKRMWKATQAFLQKQKKGGVAALEQEPTTVPKSRDKAQKKRRASEHSKEVPTRPHKQSKRASAQDMDKEAWWEA